MIKLVWLTSVMILSLLSCCNEIEDKEDKEGYFYLYVYWCGDQDRPKRHVFLYSGDIKNYPEYLPDTEIWWSRKIKSSLIPKIKKIIGDVSSLERNPSLERRPYNEYLVVYSFGKQEFIHILDSDWWDAILKIRAVLPKEAQRGIPEKQLK